MPAASRRLVWNFAGTLGSDLVTILALRPRHAALRSARLGGCLLFAAALLCGPLVAADPQYSLATADTAPVSLAEGARDDLLRITATHAGTSGADLEMASLGLRLESAAGVPLTAAQTPALLAALEVYADANLSGAFEPDADTLVAAQLVPTPAADGTLTLSFAHSDPAEVRVAAGQSRTWFVVAAFATGAAGQTPSTLRVTHLTSGPLASVARDAATGQPLALQPVPDVASGIVAAQANAAPTTTGLADVLTFEPAHAGSVALFGAFQDAQDSPEQLTYAVTANTNPALFRFVGIDPAKGTLALDYAPGASGSASLTVRATDRSGLSVATTFKVTAALIRNYAEWAGFHFGTAEAAGGSQQQDATGRSNLAKYAFALDPQKLGDVAGLPRIENLGASRLVTHLRPKYATDLAYQYEISPDLAAWQPAVKGQHYYENATALADGRTRVELLLLVKWPRVFVRANASLTGAPVPAPVFAAAPAPAPDAAAPAESAAPPAPLLLPPGTEPIHGTAIFPQQNVLNNNARYASSVAIADLDGDGLPDLISASVQDDKIAWYRNLGGGVFSTEQLISTTIDQVFRVATTDFDGDGRLDVYAGAPGKLVWFRNLGGGSFSGPLPVFTGTFLSLYVNSIAVADLDGDGLTDAISTSPSFDGVPANNKIAWYRNLGGGLFGPQQIVSNAARGVYCAVPADVDGDGKIDLVSSSGDNKIAWYRNLGGGVFDLQQIISNQTDNPLAVCVADLDQDGALDVVSVSSADNKVAWYRNLGGGVFAPQIVLSTEAAGASGVCAADLNGDGFPEIIAAAFNSDRLLWFDNLGGTFAPAAVLTTATDAPLSVAAADLNGDGTVDVASASQVDGEVAWYPNFGGQFALATAGTAPAAIVEGAGDDVLRIAVSNRGLPGNHHARLRSLALLFESAPGVSLDTTAANQLIDRLSIYADHDASGDFDPSADKLLHTAFHLPLQQGRLALALDASAAPEWQVPPGETRHFFVVAHLAKDAAAAIPAAFRITHCTSGVLRTIGQDAQTGAKLTLEPVADVASALVTAQPNQPPTTTGIPAITVADTVVPTSLALWPFFSDAEDGAAQLRYTVVGNSNPGLFSFVGINPATGTLLLKYRAGVGGTTQLAVRATDSLGKSVTASFAVNVEVVASLEDWLNLHFTGVPPGALGIAPEDILGYAFALDPRVSGDLAGLPRVESIGQARVLRHLRPRYAVDLACDYEISTDLLEWTPAINGVDYFEFRTDLPAARQQVDLVILAPGQRVFLRARPRLVP